MTPHLALVRRMCDDFDVSEDDVRSGCRLPTALRVRRLAVYVLRLDRGLTYGEIAHALRIKRCVAHKFYRMAAERPDPEVVRYLGATG